ncbi:MAG: hypothetical protein QM756_15215 [Polyangiaceae bacterium]
MHQDATPFDFIDHLAERLGEDRAVAARTLCDWIAHYRPKRCYEIRFGSSSSAAAGERLEARSHQAA